MCVLTYKKRTVFPSLLPYSVCTLLLKQTNEKSITKDYGHLTLSYAKDHSTLFNNNDSSSLSVWLFIHRITYIAYSCYVLFVCTLKN